MIEFGKSLRAARETKGLTLSQVAESTHMLRQIVEGLESEDFSQIVAPIYGRGFVKLYCETVGLEPKPFIEQFMLLYNGATMKAEPSPLPPSSPASTAADTAPASTAGFTPPLRLNGRLLTIAAATGVVLILLILGLRALYRATTVDLDAAAVETYADEPAPEPTPEPTPGPAPETATPPTAAPRQPLPIKPFYAD